VVIGGGAFGDYVARVEPSVAAPAMAEILRRDGALQPHYC